ncbi:MAG TPA: hypothetical protein VK163_15200 [Opitutaceae bacterium]|nr:hypothetical protein [Opitutaceae bacterium]
MKPTTLFDWIALIGALAWLPPLISLLRSLLTRPLVRIIAERKLELGFTSFGPIINVRMAFSTERKDVVITNLEFSLRHESGEQKVFRWEGVTQKMLQMQTLDAGTIPFEKEINVLAMKITMREVEERFVRFQDPIFHESKEPYEAKVVKKLSHFLSQKPESIDPFLEMEETKDLASFVTQAFAWKPGKYSLTFSIESPERFVLKDQNYEFVLGPLDIEALEKNKENILKDLKNQILNYDKEKSEKIAWSWRYPKLKKNQA